MTPEGINNRSPYKNPDPKPKQEQHAPHTWTQPNYGAKQQLTAPKDTTAPLTAEAINHVQQIARTYFTMHEQSKQSALQFWLH
jgi:hypothetical protein